MTNTVKVPPDGGYGWVIVFANALSNLMIIPIMQSFGLIFKDTFIEMGLSATQGSLIINLNAAFGMLVGLINGVLLKIFGYRKMAYIAATLVTVGIALTSFSRTFTHFLIAYGMITSLGMGLCMSAYGLALNTYFKKRKSKAVGITMTITGLGPILMPQLINLLMKFYTVQGVTLILGGISSHNFLAASLLQPVKRHLKTEQVDSEKLEPIQEQEDEEEEVKPERRKFSRSVSHSENVRKNSVVGSNWSIDHDIETAAIYGMDSALGGSVLSLHSIAPSRRLSVSHNWKKASSLSIPEAKNHDNIYNPELSKPIHEKPYWKRLFQSFVQFFDLDLLKDPIYVNIMLGISLAIFAELNFSVLTAFILADIGLNTDQIATFMSILGVADIVFRFLAPYIGNYLNKPPRPMYVISLFMLMGTRFSLLISDNYIILLGVALGLGIAKGVRTVYMTLVIPTYVPLEKLASASGLQMMINGICILIGGPIIGMVRDVTGSYTWCIIIMNCVTFTTIVMWTVEAVIVRLRKKTDPTVELSEQQDTLLNKT